MEKVWQFAGSSKQGEPFEIKGVNVWDSAWQASTGRETEVHVNDPVYGQAYFFRIYSIQNREDTIEFAAGEFSNGIWGFYTRE